MQVALMRSETMFNFKTKRHEKENYNINSNDGNKFSHGGSATKIKHYKGK
jgi:predicted ATPase